jgi:hypothetical protein
MPRSSGRPQYRDVYPRRRRRHPIRRFFSEIRRSMRGIGLALVLALVVAAVLVYAFMPAAETTWGFFHSDGPALSPEQQESMRKAREQREQRREQQ